jgi:hypothetical protein
MMASEGEAVTLDAETIRHDGKPAETADPREGTDLAMTTVRTMAAIKVVRIVILNRIETSMADRIS